MLLSSVVSALPLMALAGDATNTSLAEVSPCEYDWGVISTGGKCLARYQNEDDLYNGAAVVLWDCDEHSAYQYWALKKTDGGFTGSWGAGKSGYCGGPVYPKFCLDAGEMESGSELFLWECNGYASQQFALDLDEGTYNDYQGSWRIGDSGCVDAGSAPAVQECDDDSGSQTWGFCTCSWAMGCWNKELTDACPWGRHQAVSV